MSTATLSGWNVCPVQQKNGDNLVTGRFKAAEPSVTNVLIGALAKPVTLLAGFSIFHAFATDEMKPEWLDGGIEMLKYHDSVDAWGRVVENASKTVVASQDFISAIAGGEGMMEKGTAVVLYSGKTIKAAVKITKHVVTEGLVQASEFTKHTLKAAAPTLRVGVAGLEIAYEIVKGSSAKLSHIGAEAWQTTVNVLASVSAIAWGVFQLNLMYAFAVVPPIVGPIVLTVFLVGVTAKQIVPRILARVGSQYQADQLNAEYELNATA